MTEPNPADRQAAAPGAPETPAAAAAEASASSPPSTCRPPGAGQQPIRRRGPWPGFAFVFQSLGLGVLCGWVGLTVGWFVLSLVHRSGGWFGVLTVVAGAYLLPPGLLLFFAGRYVGRRSGWLAPAAARRLVWLLAAAVLVAGALGSYLAGWPR